MMSHHRFLNYLFLVIALLFCSTQIYADCFSDTVNFDPDQGYIYNYPWQHCLSDLPTGCVVESTEIRVRAKVWYWGWYPYEQDILCSDTNEFNYSKGYVCSLTSSSHPNPSNFYTIICNLNQYQLEWLLNDGRINFIMVTFGGTYYLDYSTLEVCCAEIPECEGDLDCDKDVDGLDLASFAANDVNDSSLSAFALNYGRTDCP